LCHAPSVLEALLERLSKLLSSPSNNGADETVEHFLTKCSKYDKQRIQNAAAGGMWTEMLLGNKTTIKSTLEFVPETNRLDFRASHLIPMRMS
jgi:hypothetical protein